MNFRMLAALVVAFAGWAAFPASASAATAHTTTTLNVRSGPGPGYARVTTLPAGHRVTVFGCEGSWCSIRAAGIRGWASANYLDRAYARPIVVQPHVIIRPPHYRPHRPHRPHKPRPPRPHKPQCKIAPGFPCK